MTDAEIVWEDPPPRTSGKGVWVHRLAPLKEHPGKWARLLGPVGAGSAAGAASLIRSGEYNGIEPGEFDAESRVLEDGAYLYARYIDNGTAP